MCVCVCVYMCVYVCIYIYIYRALCAVSVCVHQGILDDCGNSVWHSCDQEMEKIEVRVKWKPVYTNFPSHRAVNVPQINFALKVLFCFSRLLFFSFFLFSPPPLCSLYNHRALTSLPSPPLPRASPFPLPHNHQIYLGKYSFDRNAEVTAWWRVVGKG